MRLIVVGNGLFSRLQGHLIDRFDTVVRLSSAKVEGFEALVGSKKDILSVARIEDCSGYDNVWAGNPFGMGSIPKRALLESYPNGFVINDSINKCYAYGDFKDGTHPTLGLLTIYMAVEYGKAFYQLPITITGFDFIHTDCARYYWDNTPNVDALGLGGIYKKHHDFDKERGIVKKMIDEGLVQYLHPKDIIFLENAIGAYKIDFRVKGEN